MRLTLRTLLAYLDDTLPPEEARAIGERVARNDQAKELMEKIRRVTRRRGLSVPSTTGDSAVYADPNLVAEYLSDALPPDKLADFETLCLESDVHLAEVAGCHQILTLLISAPMRVPPTATRKMYSLVSGPESIPNREPGPVIPVGGVRPDEFLPDDPDADAAYLLGMRSRADELGHSRIRRWALYVGLLLALTGSVWLSWVNAVPADPPVAPPVPVVEKQPDPPEPEPDVVPVPDPEPDKIS